VSESESEKDMHCMHTLERARETGGETQWERKSERDSERQLYAAMHAYVDV